jgi:hypothetical protein
MPRQVSPWDVDTDREEILRQEEEARREAAATAAAEELARQEALAEEARQRRRANQRTFGACVCVLSVLAACLLLVCRSLFHRASPAGGVLNPAPRNAHSQPPHCAGDDVAGVAAAERDDDDDYNPDDDSDDSQERGGRGRGRGRGRGSQQQQQQAYQPLGMDDSYGSGGRAEPGRRRVGRPPGRGRSASARSARGGAAVWVMPVGPPWSRQQIEQQMAQLLTPVQQAMLTGNALLLAQLANSSGPNAPPPMPASLVSVSFFWGG